MGMNRTMLLRETGNLTKDYVEGALVTQVGEGELRDNTFWVSRDEAPDLIRMLADTFDINLERLR
jgi:hypothetical protein